MADGTFNHWDHHIKKFGQIMKHVQLVIWNILYLFSLGVYRCLSDLKDTLGQTIANISCGLARYGQPKLTKGLLCPLHRGKGDASSSSDTHSFKYGSCFPVTH